MFSWYSFQIFPKLLVTIPVAPVITGIIVHFSFHIRCISIHKLLYLLLLLLLYCCCCCYYYYYYYYWFHRITDDDVTANPTCVTSISRAAKIGCLRTMEWTAQSRRRTSLPLRHGIRLKTVENHNSEEQLQNWRLYSWACIF